MFQKEASLLKYVSRLSYDFSRSIWKQIALVGFSKALNCMSPYGECNLSFLKNKRSANYFQIERENWYDYFLIMYITKLQCKMRFGVAHAYSRHRITSTSFTPPKQKIWLVLTKPSCLVANQKPEFCEYIALNWLFLPWSNSIFPLRLQKKKN